MFETGDLLQKTQIATLVITSISNFFCFVAMLTPSWQVADDLDANRSIQSGLWIYCPGASQCWYIFSDTLINYYERVDVCRFLLIGDCRKKLLRTPYFFGWHYAVLILIIIALLFSSAAFISVLVGYYRPKLLRISTAVLDLTISLSFLLLCIALAVFMINAEMLESRYLIGVKNTFEKTYGYSFYLACTGLTVLLFAMVGAVLITTWVFFFNIDTNAYSTNNINNNVGFNHYDDNRTTNYVLQSDPQNRKYIMMQEAQPPAFDYLGSPLRHCYSPSEMSIPTRTFLSY